MLRGVSTRPFFKSPFLILLFLELLTFLAVRPFGDFALNDDWQYAVVAKQFAETGQLKVVVPVAPTLVVQTLLAYPVIRVFGFSHFALRMLTFVVSLGLMGMLNLILRAHTSLSKTMRLALLCTVAFNPIFFQLKYSFMSECYGFLVALIGLHVLLKPGARNHYLGALISGLSFWARQFSALIYVGFWLARVWDRLRDFGWIKDRRFWVREVGPALVFNATVVFYFSWSKWSGNYKPEFASPLGSLFHPQIDRIWVQMAFALMYQTFFLAPLLWLHPWSERVALSGNRRERLRRVLGYVFLILPPLAYAMWKYSWPDQGAQAGRPFFPFYGNLFNHNELGPTTLTDDFMIRMHAPSTAIIGFWFAVQIALMALGYRWIGVWQAMKRSKALLVWGGFWSGVVTFCVTCLAFRGFVFDRYWVGILLGTILVLGSLARGQGAAPLSKPRLRTQRASAGVLVAISLYAVVGTSDYFRWHEARQRLIARAVKQGIALKDIDAGYEPNGWTAYDENRVREDPCRLTAWFCVARPYRIATAPNPRGTEFAVVDEEPIRGAILTRKSPLLLMKRAGAYFPPPLHRWE